MQISGAKYSTTKSGDDLIFTVGTGKITVVGGTNTTFNIEGTLDSGTDTTPTDTLPVGISVKSGVLTTSTKFTGNEINLADYEATKVNASAMSKAVSIVGSDFNDSITGGNGADTISGGSGKNTLTGGNGKDIFVYESGNDIITDYKAGEDSIKISGKISQTSYKGKDVIFTIGDGTLTVKNSKGKEISVTDSSGTQTYSKTLDLIYDNNFIGDEFGLDSITEKEFEVENIETKNNLEIEQPVITYGEDK